MITFHKLPNIFYVKHKRLWWQNISFSKKGYGSAAHFTKLCKVFKVNTRTMINCNSLKLLFDWNFHNKVVCRVLSNVYLAFQKHI